MAELAGTPMARPQAARVAAASITGTTEETANTVLTLTDDRVQLFWVSDLDAEIVLIVVYSFKNASGTTTYTDTLAYVPAASGGALDLRTNKLALYKGALIKAYRQSGAAASGAIRLGAV
jgi:hypothetical protein